MLWTALVLGLLVGVAAVVSAYALGQRDAVQLSEQWLAAHRADTEGDPSV